MEAATTIEAWAEAYIRTSELAAKLTPPPLPERWQDAPTALCIASPGRPAELLVKARAKKSPTQGALAHPERRAQLLHTFLHHELQAAELMAWALLAFPETPRAFKLGLLGVLADEVRHMGMYRDHLRTLGFDVGAFVVRDWFWERVPSCPTPTHFVALMGMGFEGGNLDHTDRFAAQFRIAGDVRGAELQEVVGEEEISHVKFALAWFRRWSEGDDFETWRRYLVSPLTPTVMRGEPLNREARRRAGMSEPFLDALANWHA